MSDTVIHERSLNISGFQNAEGEIQRIINEEAFYRITEVLLKGADLKIVFERGTNEKKYPSFVKQISKKKHTSLEEFVCSQSSTYADAILITALDLGNKWLLFFEKWLKCVSVLSLATYICCQIFLYDVKLM